MENKKIIYVVLVIISLTLAVVLLSGSNDSYLKPPCDSYGDVNLDGCINEQDIELLNNHLTGINLLTNEQIERSDLNVNGRIDIGDVSVILSYVEGKINTFPICGT